MLPLPDDGKRYGIIEGEIYEMPSPNVYDAATRINLLFLVGPVVQSIRGRIFTAPLDIVFEGVDPVPPDIVILLSTRSGRLRRRGPQGAPDLVIEVLSPCNCSVARRAR